MELSVTEPVRGIVFSDLGVTLDIPDASCANYRVLGLRADGSVAVLCATDSFSYTLQRFALRDGTWLAGEPVAITQLPIRRLSSDAVLMGGSDHLLVAEEDRIYRHHIGESRGDTLRVPFRISALIAADGERIIAASSGEIEPPSLFEIRQVGGGVRRLTTTSLMPSTRIGAMGPNGTLVTVPVGEYRVELWGDDGLPDRVVDAPRFIRRYLSGPYSGFSVTRAHFLDDMHLVLSVRLQLRDPPPVDPQAEDGDLAFLASEYDGLLEVIDLRTGAIVASRFQRHLQFRDWISGAVGYDEPTPRRVRLVHVGLSD